MLPRTPGRDGGSHVVGGLGNATTCILRSSQSYIVLEKVIFGHRQDTISSPFFFFFSTYLLSFIVHTYTGTLPPSPSKKGYILKFKYIRLTYLSTCIRRCAKKLMMLCGYCGFVASFGGYSCSINWMVVVGWVEWVRLQVHGWMGRRGYARYV